VEVAVRMALTWASPDRRCSHWRLRLGEGVSDRRRGRCGRGGPEASRRLLPPGPDALFVCPARRRHRLLQHMFGRARFHRQHPHGGTRRATLEELANWTRWAEQAITF